MLLAFLLFLKPFLNGLEHGCHIGQLLVALKLLVGLTCIGGLTWGCTEGLAILVVFATVAGVVRLVRAAVSLSSQCPIVPAWRSDRIKSELVYATYLHIYYPILSPPHNPQLSVNKECVRDDECVDCTIHALESAAKGCCDNQIRWEHESEQLPR